MHINNALTVSFKHERKGLFFWSAPSFLMDYPRLSSLTLLHTPAFFCKLISCAPENQPESVPGASAAILTTDAESIHCHPECFKMSESLLIKQLL
jgi:hypothetical protein